MKYEFKKPNINNTIQETFTRQIMFGYIVQQKKVKLPFKKNRFQIRFCLGYIEYVTTSDSKKIILFVFYLTLYTFLDIKTKWYHEKERIRAG